MASLIACINVIEKYFCNAVAQKHRCWSNVTLSFLGIISLELGNYLRIVSLELGVPNSLIASTIWVTPGSYLRDQGAVPRVNAE